MLQFGRFFPIILQALLEADPFKVVIQVSKMDVTNAYHHGNVKLSQVGAFAHIIPSAPGDESCIICINLKPANGVGGITQVFLHVFVNAD